jgi:hypothetical protein
MSAQNETFKEKFIGHINNNRGKYGVGAGIGGTIGVVNLAGNGYLGVRAQDAIHDAAYPISQKLHINAIQNGTTAKIDPYLDVYKKKDNLFTNNNNDQLLSVEQVLQKENIPAVTSYIGSKLVSGLSGLDQNEKLNYMLRNPGNSMALKIDELKAPIKGAINSIENI